MQGVKKKRMKAKQFKRRKEKTKKESKCKCIKNYKITRKSNQIRGFQQYHQILVLAKFSTIINFFVSQNIKVRINKRTPSTAITSIHTLLYNKMK